MGGYTLQFSHLAAICFEVRFTLNIEGLFTCLLADILLQPWLLLVFVFLHVTEQNFFFPDFHLRKID